METRKKIERQCDEGHGLEEAERRRCARLEQVALTPTLQADPVIDNGDRRSV